MKHTLVTGANGRTGRRVVAKLVAGGVKVRAFVRREDAAAEMMSMGVADCTVGNLEHTSDLIKAVRGIQQVVHICPPMHPEEDRIGFNLIAAAQETGVELFVEYSVLHPVIEVPHHRRKLAVEAALIDSNMPYVILQPARYMQHLNTIWAGVQSDAKHVLPFSTQTRFSLVDLEDLADCVAKVVREPRHAFATYQLAGPQPLSMEDCAREISALLGRHIEAVERDAEAVRNAAEAAGMPAQRIEAMATMNRHYSAHGLVGNPNVLRWLLGREPTTYADFVRRELLR